MMTSIRERCQYGDVARIMGISSPMTYYIASVKFCQPKKNDIKSFANFVINQNIDVIINVSDTDASEDLLLLYKNLGLRYVYYPIKDKFLNVNEYMSLNKKLNTIYAQVNEWNNKSKRPLNILVHCTAGVNRSALVISHQLLLSTSNSIDDIIQNIRKSNQEIRRTPALTNNTFVSLLECLK